MDIAANTKHLIGTSTTTTRTTKAAWTGRFLSGLVILALSFDAVGKLLRLPPVIAGTKELGYPVTVIFGLGLVLAASVLLYAIPRTSALGALFLTAYLGGAVATHVRVGSPLLTHVLSPVYVALFVWVGLCLRDRRVLDVFTHQERR